MEAEMRHYDREELHKPVSGGTSTFARNLHVFEPKIFRFSPGIPILSFALLLLFCLWTAPAFGQLDQGSIIGTVSDAQSRVVPGVTVTLTEVDTNFVVSMKTDQSGSYFFSPIKIGNYSLAAAGPGFKTTTQTGLVLHVNQRLAVNVQLEIGAEAQSVTVSADQAPLLQSEQSSTGQVITSKTLNETPLNGRNYVFIAQLTAGVDQANGTRGEGKGDFNSNGQRAEQNNFILDGVDNNSNAVDFLNGATFVVKPTPDALAEFKVQTSNYDAEFGHSAGAVVNASIKSGTNSFHGDLWEYFRNDALDARDFNALTIPKYRQNQFGATIGGPIIKNKLFFFGDAEANRIIFGETSVETVPTPLMRQGNFMELLNPSLTGSQAVTLYQPQSGGSQLLQCNSQQNVFCADQINAIAQKILNLYPLPNTNSGKTYNNYTVNRNSVDNTAQWDGRLDWNISQKDQAFFRMSYENEPAFHPSPLGQTLDGGGYADTGTNVNLGENYALSETHVFAPTLINEFRFGYNYGHFSYLQPNSDVDVSSQLGIGGVPFGPLNGGLPFTSIGGISNYGTIYNYPANEFENVYQILDNITKSFGKQTLKAGVSFQHVRYTVYSPTWGKGFWSYNGTFTGQPGTSFTGYGVADYLADAQSSNTLSTVAGPTDDARWYRSGYLQDDWTILPRLTLNLGLRYDYYQSASERHDQQANFDVLSAAVGSGTAEYLLPIGAQKYGLSSAFTDIAAKDHVAITYTGNRSLAEAQKINVGPRVGFAFSPTNKLVVRGGFGLFFGGLESVGGSPNLGNNYPFSINSNFNAPSCILNSPCATNGITLANGYSAQIAAGLQNLVALPTANEIDHNIKTTYSEQFNLSTQYAVSKNTSATLAYVGNVGRHLVVQSNNNPPAALAIPGTNTQQYTPFPDFGNGYYLNFGAASSYNALQGTLERRFADGLYFLATYTWAHSLDDAPTPLGATGDSGLQNPLLIPLGYEYGNSPYDVRHRVTFNGNYQLPFGTGRKYLNRKGPLDEMVGGWSLNVVFTAQTGNPFSVGPNISTAAGGNAVALLTGNPNQGGGSPNSSNPDISCPTHVRNKTNWYNPCAFSNPLPGSLIGAGNLVTTTGDALKYLGRGRDQVYGPGYNRTAASFFKNFTTFREQYLQFRADVFNVFNTPAYGQPPSGINSSSGQITGPRFTGNYTPDARFFQLALKYVF
jgi:hypothetical protein